MEVKQRLVIDLAYPGAVQVAYAVQGDSGTRALDIELRANQAPWEIPEDTAVMVHYQRRSDGGGGTYDTLPDGARAWQISGNVLTVLLAPQVCGINGDVAMELTLLQGEKQLTTFRFIVRVSGSVGDLQEEGDYTNLSTWLEANIGPALDAAAGSAAAAEKAKNEAEAAAGAAHGAAGAAAASAAEAAASKQEANAAAGNALASANAAGQSATAANQAKEGAEGAATAAQVSARAAAKSAAEAAEIKEEMVSLMDKTIIRDTMSGPIVQGRFIEGTPLDYTIRMEATQDGEGDPSLENVRPITGAGSVDVTVCGRNLFHVPDGIDQYYGGVRITTSGGAITVNGTSEKLVSTRSYLKLDLTGLHYSGMCSFTSGVENIDMYGYVKKTENDNVSYPINRYNIVGNELAVEFFLQVTYGAVFNNLRFVPVFVLGETLPDNVEPYTGTTHTIQLPETSYGGYIDWGRRKYVQTHGLKVFDGSETLGFSIAFLGMAYFELNAMKRLTNYAAENSLMCNKLKTLASPIRNENNEDFAITGHADAFNNPGKNWIYFRFDSAISSVELMKSYLAEQYELGNPLTVVYPLAEPIEYDLPDLPALTALDGITTVYSDAKEVEITGYLTAKDYIDKKIIELTALTLEVQK